MRRSLLALAMVCVVGLSACGGDDDANEATPSSDTTAAATQATAKGGRFCELFGNYNDRYSRTRNVTDRDELRDLLRGARSELEEAKNVAPPEVKADTEVIARVVDEYVDALEDVDYDVNRIPVNTAQRLLSPDFLGAAQRTQTYVVNACG